MSLARMLCREPLPSRTPDEVRPVGGIAQADAPRRDFYRYGVDREDRGVTRKCGCPLSGLALARVSGCSDEAKASA